MKDVSNMAGEHTLAKQKGHNMMHTYTPNQYPYQVSTFYTLWEPHGHYDKFKLRSHHNVAHLQPLTNIPT